MTKTFTENDLVRFLYDELNKKEKESLQQALLTDTDLQNELEKLKSVMKGLNEVRYAPSEKTVNKILEFSKGYHKQTV